MTTPHLFRTIVPVLDVKRAGAFYSGLLELEIDPVSPERHYLHTSGCILAIIGAPERVEAQRPNPEWTYLRVADLDAALVRARALGAEIVDEGEGGGIAERAWGERSFYLRDPDGNPICLLDDAASTADASYCGKPPSLYKATLPVRDLERTGAFWSDLLSMPIDRGVPGRHFVFCRGAVLALIDTTAHDRAHGKSPRAFLPNPDTVYLAVADLDATWARAQALGAEDHDDPHVAAGIHTRPWGERSFYLRDPAGNPAGIVDAATLFTGRGS
jgi:predicted enzyme related to lactoylglutathione lyase